MAQFERDSEFAAFAKIGEKSFQALELIAIFLREADRRLEAFLPAAEKKEALLRREHQRALVPTAIFENTQVFKKLPDIDGFGSGNWNVVGGPRISAGLVFAPTRVPTSLRVHFEQDEVVKAALVQAPGRT